MKHLPAVTIFFGSLLLFCAQPMLGRTLLPPFGGSAAVWTVCLASYQLLLLLGYLYAHRIARLPRARQRGLHLTLLGLAVIWLIAFALARPALGVRMGVSGLPALEVFVWVVALIGLPYLLLAANSTLVQAWLSGGSDEAAGQGAGGGGGKPRSIYRLYAVSNLGSFCGLLLYPFALEPYVGLGAQWWGFAAASALYSVLMLALARSQPGGGEVSRGSRGAGGACPAAGGLSAESSHPSSRVGGAAALLWLLLPGLSVFLLNAVTIHLSTDVTPVPLMWVVLLAAFLMSYVIGFSVVGERGLPIWAAAAVVALLGAANVARFLGGAGFLANLAFGTATVLFSGAFLHSWLYRIRPGTDQLTRFYLRVAAGGALGGVAASLLAPLVLNGPWEYPLALLLALVAVAWYIHFWNPPELRGFANFLLLMVLVAAALVLYPTKAGKRGSVLARSRNFYGCLRVEHNESVTALGTRVPFRSLHNGQTLHGIQGLPHYLRRSGSTYYGTAGGGLAITAHESYTSAPMRVGLIGLGVGTMAVYGRAGDTYRFYEIDPQVTAVAQNTNLFTFLADSPARIEVAQGDARKLLEQERDRNEERYDVLVLDAYSGDSIPYHLATKEAFDLFLERLKPDGILALHISNWHIDLLPLGLAAAREFGLELAGVESGGGPSLTTSATWLFLGRSPRQFAAPGTRAIEWSGVKRMALPTDDRGSILPLIRFSRRAPPPKFPWER